MFISHMHIRTFMDLVSFIKFSFMETAFGIVGLITFYVIIRLSKDYIRKTRQTQ